MSQVRLAEARRQIAGLEAPPLEKPEHDAEGIRDLNAAAQNDSRVFGHRAGTLRDAKQFSLDTPVGVRVAAEPGQRQAKCLLALARPSVPAMGKREVRHDLPLLLP